MNLLGGGVVLDKLAILHVVASAHPVDLLVHLSPVKKSIGRGKCKYMSKQSFSNVCLKVYYQTPPMIGEALANPSDFCCKLWKH